ncbi:SDR family NAD(P)-dependent oxidoreductase [Sphingomonas sp. ID1715]|nr:SDR family NAD(P)-dependent oxidoreductase [Sphingomonas sp. ID1715]
MAVRLKPIEQQTIVVTGATSGNGLATVEAAVERGAAVVLAARNLDALEEVAVRLRSRGARVAVCAADVSKPEDVQRIADTALTQLVVSIPG